MRTAKMFTGERKVPNALQQLAQMRTWSISAVSLPVLHSLHIRHARFDEDVAKALGSYVVRTTTLKSIAFHGIKVEDKDAATFLVYLAENKTLLSLLLHEDFVMARQGEALAHVLRNHVSLEELEISGTVDYTPSATLRAAPLSCSLKSLTVKCFRILADDIEAMAAALMRDAPSFPKEANTAAATRRASISYLECLSFSWCNDCEPRLQRAYAALIGGVLKQLTITDGSLGEDFACAAASQLRVDFRLRVLNIQGNWLPVPSTCALVRALEVNTTLEELKFSLYDAPSELGVLPLFNAVRENGVCSRLHVNWHEPCLPHVTQGGCLGRISYIDMDLDKHCARDVANLLEPLASRNNVITACLLCANPMEEAVVQHLVGVLGKTKSLRELNLLLNWPETKIVSVLRSLEQNSSLWVLEIDGMTFRKRFAKALGRLVENNRSLIKIVVNLVNEWSGGFQELRAVRRELKDAVPRNYFLTEVVVNFQDSNHATDFAIKQALRRNKMLVNRAVHFVEGSGDKEEAHAFDTVQYSRALLTALCKSRTDRDEARGQEQILNARRRLALDYFILTGVVKATIACRPHPKGKPTLGNLSKEVQAHICSYLSLTDVMVV